MCVKVSGCEAVYGARDEAEGVQSGPVWGKMEHQIEELVGQGFEFGSHSCGLTDATVRADHNDNNDDDDECYVGGKKLMIGIARELCNSV